ncbi:hypothetical protein BUALT_Bualt16G0062300 [Buddleja alternifolia]|uniref:Uncharacterized protein n=1 Tax=Buddleja alternifolia TaxID=168488 RepID=A0AAV6WKC2_9LAMI|nr:hypothetical protein BUALT_Bualt16G0062300 [Buddleja alternifolia]
MLSSLIVMHEIFDLDMALTMPDENSTTELNNRQRDSQSTTAAQCLIDEMPTVVRGGGECTVCMEGFRLGVTVDYLRMDSQDPHHNAEEIVAQAKRMRERYRIRSRESLSTEDRDAYLARGRQNRQQQLRINESVATRQGNGDGTISNSGK